MGAVKITAHEDAKYQLHNQAEYDGGIALITSRGTGTGYSISVFDGEKVITHDNIDGLNLPALRITENIIKGCKPDKSELYYSFYADGGKSKAEVFPDGRCRFTVNGERQYDGFVEYLHELQNLFEMHLGYMPYCDLTIEHDKIEAE